MESDRLNRWLTLFANLGVLIGIVLLLIELNQTQEIARAEIRNEIYQGLSPLTMMEPYRIGAIIKANAGEPLDSTETFLVSGFGEQMHRYWENSTYQYSMGMYDESEFSAQQNIIRDASLTLFPGALIPHYCTNRAAFSDSYKAMMDNIITPQICQERDL